MAKSSPQKKIVVETVKHKDKRTNIPTEELRNFVKDEEKKPETVLYPRDPSLDPQLVWKGKDEQDSKPLAVPAVPIYIQEKIHPQAIIENIRAEAKKEAPGQASLFSDFNGIKFEDLIDFYHHQQNWANRMILGDSLMVMTSLAEKEGLKGKVQMIYIDPPYGINFGSNWQVSTRKRDVKDGKVADATRQPEQIRAFRDTWKLGIHSYLAYLRDRLAVARELLTESGSVFVQIGDENVHLVRCVLDEVFGSENFVVTINLKKKGNQKGEKIESITDYILLFSKNKELMKYRDIYLSKDNGEQGYVSDQLTSGGLRKNQNYDYVIDGKAFKPASGNCWKIVKEGMDRVRWAERILVGPGQIRFKKLDSDFGYSTLTNNWDDTGGASDLLYVVQTATKVIQRCILITTDPGDLVLDPTCGSGTTAFVAEQWGRRWITCDTSRVALALARTRLMAAKYPYYTLADSIEGFRKEAEISGKLPPDRKTDSDIKKGFVYKRVPHVTLGSIANNPDIREGMSRAEIDAAIARHADTERLYDQPYEDNKRIRVTGPFTVESLSPHRVLSTNDDLPASEKKAAKSVGSGQFETMILDNLKKAGVQNTIKKERLVFDRLESYAGICIQAIGTYTESGKPRRAAVCIGPEHGTVGSDLVKEAAKEAVKGIGFDILVVCGFAFDPHVSEEARQYGKLTVLLARMNPDLAMGDDLLKKTGAGNLFMVFGEPDVEIKKQKDGQLTVEIKGVDVYDPTTGEIRSHTTEDIACWFIDTSYNSESFFVRQAYFAGSGEPYEKLKRALKAEIDEESWSALYATKSIPFDVPKTGKIAVKVINHYGDEVLKVYEIES